MRVTRAFTPTKLAGKLAGVLAVAALLPAMDANAAAWRWSEPTVTPTLNDGLELRGVNLRGQSLIHSVSTPFFMLDGQRYELGEARRVSELERLTAPGFTQLLAQYEVPVEQGLVKATVSYTLLDERVAGYEPSQLSAWVQFEGPQGDYRFFWRMDVDPGQRAGNLAELLGQHERPELQTQEAMLDLSRGSLRVRDGKGGDEQTQLELLPRAEDQARAYLVQFRGGEMEALPQTLVNGEALTGRKDGGDLVLWYETQLNGVRGGLTGPDMSAVAATRVNAILEQDKMTSAEFVETSVTVFNEARSFQGAFGDAGIRFTDVKNDDNALANDTSSTNSELHSLMVANTDYDSQDSATQWYSWVGTVLQSSSGSGVLGIMFDDGATNTDGKPRQGCAVFYNPHKNGSWPSGDTYMAELLLTLTHETGHVYNQHHEDFCAGRFSFSTFRSNSAIMGYAFMDTSQWTFSPGTVTTLTSEPEEYSRPGTGYAFTTSGAYNMTSEHEAKHSSTSCRRVCCLNQ